MRIYLTMILILCGIAMGTSQEVYADGECTPNKQYKDAYNEAVAAEKSGNLALAFVVYDFSHWENGCEGPNPFAKDAKTGWKRTGLRLAREAEAKGDFYSYGGSSTTVTGPSGFSWTVWKDVGAFYWYSQIGESADADRMMSRFAQSKPKDISALGAALGHFFHEGQAGVVDHPEALRELEEKARANPGDQQLQKTVGYLRELQQIAFKNIDEALIQEEKSYSKYNRKETVMGQNPVDESLRHLSVARDWYQLFGDPHANKVAERAGKRGDAMMQDERSKSFSYARNYYELGSLSDKLRKLTEQANKLGDAAAKKGEYAPAVEYYEIGHSATGENEDKINKLFSLLEKETEKKEQAKQKALRDMTKDDKQQKEFKKGQEDLEKELGF